MKQQTVVDMCYVCILYIRSRVSCMTSSFVHQIFRLTALNMQHSASVYNSEMCYICVVYIKSRVLSNELIVTSSVS